MKNNSRKAKARYLQNIVRDKIRSLYPKLSTEDIRCSMMSENGADVKLTSMMARKLFPYSIECKNREDSRGIYQHYKQAARHAPLEPMLVIKMNREKPLVIIDLDHFFDLQKDHN